MIHYNRGVAYSRLGDSGEALAEFDAALRLDPNLAVARTARDRVPARLASLVRSAPPASRPAAQPPKPSPSGMGAAPSPQDDRPSGALPTPPVPSVNPR